MWTRLSLGFVLAFGGAPVFADASARAMEVLGAYGCTLESGSRAALGAAGLDEAAISELTEAALAAGEARQEREYVVFAKEVCEIGLPYIENEARLEDADIAAQITDIDHYVQDQKQYAEERGEAYKGEGEGCYFRDVPPVFDAREGGARGAGGVEYIRFVGAHIAKGDVRFYGHSPFKTPISLRVMARDCGATEQGDEIRANHRFVREGFGSYVRTIGESTPCAEAPNWQGMSVAAKIQGFDPDSEVEPDPPINAWLYFEYEMMAMAAGWYAGMSGTEKGTPRPPLCTYGG